MHLNEKEKEELIRLARSLALRKDLRHIHGQRLDRLKNKSKCDADIWLTFVNAYNAFINHAPKSFCPFIEKNMKL